MVRKDHPDEGDGSPRTYQSHGSRSRQQDRTERDSAHRYRQYNQQGGRGDAEDYQGHTGRHHGHGGTNFQPATDLSRHRDRGGYQTRGENPRRYRSGHQSGEQTGGVMDGGHNVRSGSTRPELHQAPVLYGRSSKIPRIPFEASSSSHSTQPHLGHMQLDKGKSLTDHAIQEATTLKSSKSTKFPLRPGFGNCGKKCILKANHFLAQLQHDMELHHYDVSITPEVPRGLNRAVMAELVKVYKDSHLGRRLPVYDGQKSLYTAGPLPFISTNFDITLQDEDDNPRQRNGRTFKVVVKFASKADLEHLKNFLKGIRADAPQETLQVLDIVLRELPTSRYCPVGRSFYSPELGQHQKLGEGLESWRGFYQSIRPTQMGLSLNIDMSSIAFIEPLPVIEYVSQLLSRDITTKSISESEHVKVKKVLRGVKVEVTHRGNMRRKYRICGLTSEATNKLSFPVDADGTTKTVVEYFQQTYGFSIRHMTLPCLQVGTTQRPNYLPMEVCKIVANQRYTRKLNERQITKLLEVTCQRPKDRESDILKAVKHNKYPKDPYALEFGINIDDRLASVDARVLPAPWLKYHDDGKEKDVWPEFGKWNMMNKRVVNGGRVSKWMCINFSLNVSNDSADNFCRALASMCWTSGMDFVLEPVVRAIRVRPELIDEALKSHYQNVKASRLRGKDLDLLIAILPDNNGSLYGDIKRICETNLGVVSQCCLAKHVFKMNRQYLANVALKINVKAGGRNTVLKDALAKKIPLVSDRATIIFGADVTHPHPGEDSSPSIAAVVASQDWPEVTKYAGSVSAQAHRQELIEDLYKEWVDPESGKKCHGGMIMELLTSFRVATRKIPERIIFYRDGVSEGQFHQVLLYELDAIRKACASWEPEYQPPVTFVVVQKRHHTRLFANDRSVDRSGNILPGTVVDTKICHPTEFDFYLCSHAGIQGTSRPAHYHVLWDENNFSADDLQTLTNNLCYTYARCTRSVSIVPPAYYAHLAAFRARFYLDSQTSDGASDTAASISSGARRARSAENVPVQSLPTLKGNLKNVMFYC